MTRIAYNDLYALVHAAFERAGFSAAENEACCRELLDAEWRGKKPFGVRLVPHVLQWHGHKKGEPEVLTTHAGAAFIEGNDTVGPYVAQVAVDQALRQAAEAGVYWVGVRNRWPWITAGFHLRRAAEAGWIALTWSASVPVVAPHGGIRPLLGTNPFGYAVPHPQGPIVFDAAATAGPAAALREAKRTGQPLPPGIAIDASGAPTRDPVLGRAGALLPFGGHKGSGVSLLIEILGGAWVGAKTGHASTRSRGMVFVVVDPNLFGFGEYMAEILPRFTDAIHATADDTPPHIPGWSPVDFEAPCEVDPDILKHLYTLSGA